jgi:DNA-binding NarL/FixJ family response regulator
MRVFWEKIGVLGPVYRLAGRGLSDEQIASKLHLTESRVETCVGWLLHFLELEDRSALVSHASGSARVYQLGHYRTQH